MRCRECGKTLMDNENICSACGFYNDRENNSLESDISTNDYFEAPKNNNVTLDDNYGELSFEDDDDDISERRKEQEEIDDLFKEKVLGEKPKKKKENDEEPKKKSKGHKENVEYIDTDDSSDFVAAFIGEDYKWIVNKPINIYALLFSWMYFIYRKLYLIGITGLVVCGLVVRFIPLASPIIIILSMVLSGVLFNSIYLAVVQRRVQSIMDNYGDLSDEQLMKKCKRKGGVAVFRALLIFLIFLVLLFLTYYRFSIHLGESKFFKDNSENEANCAYIGKDLFNKLVEKEEKEMLGSSLDELACHVIVSGDKNYDIIMKLKNSGEYRYIYYSTDNDKVTIEGDTNYIDIIEKAKKVGPVSKDDEEILEFSKSIETRFNDIKINAKQEEESVKKRKMSTQRTYFAFTKDQIFKKAKR